MLPIEISAHHLGRRVTVESEICGYSGTLTKVEHVATQVNKSFTGRGLAVLTITTSLTLGLAEVEVVTFYSGDGNHLSEFSATAE